MSDVHEGYLPLKDTDNEQNNFANKLENIDKGIKSEEKKLFLRKIRLFFTVREKVLNNFKNRLFLVKNLKSELEFWNPET